MLPAPYRLPPVPRCPSAAQLGRHLPQRATWRQPPRLRQDRRRHRPPALAAAAQAVGPAVPGALQLRHRDRLLELGDGPEHLADQLRGRRVGGEGIGVVAGDEDQVAREAAGGLDEDRAGVGERGVRQKLHEAGPVAEVVGAADGLVVILTDQLEPVRGGVGADRLALADGAVLVGAEVGGRAGAVVGVRLRRQHHSDVAGALAPAQIRSARTGNGDQMADEEVDRFCEIVRIVDAQEPAGQGRYLHRDLTV